MLLCMSGTYDLKRVVGSQSIKLRLFDNSPSILLGSKLSTWSIFAVLLKQEPMTKRHHLNCRVFSRDVTMAMLVSLNKGTVAMLVSLTNPPGIELFYHANVFFCFVGKTWLLITLVKTLCSLETTFAHIFLFLELILQQETRIYINLHQSAYIVFAFFVFV